MSDHNKSGMLVLTRRLGEGILVGDELLIVCRAIKGSNQLRLGLISDKSKKIKRLTKEDVSKLLTALSAQDQVSFDETH